MKIEAGQSGNEQGMAKVQTADDLKEGPELQIENGDGPKDLPGEH